jgi:hypothetical protein
MAAIGRGAACVQFLGGRMMTGKKGVNETREIVLAAAGYQRLRHTVVAPDRGTQSSSIAIRWAHVPYGPRR